MKIAKKLLFAASLFLIYFIVKEFLQLYYYTRSIDPLFGYATLAAVAAFSIYFILIPAIQIFKIPRNIPPAKDESKVQDVIDYRMERFRKNKFLLSSKFDFTGVENNREGYDKVVAHLTKETDRIRKKYVSQLFYRSSIVQNGFLDAILILSSSTNLIKEIFTLYYGRTSNRDLLSIGKQVYYSIAIGGSEGIEYAAEEIYSKFATGGMKSIPFAEKILGSIADGFVNAALLTRVSLITENYCSLLYIKSKRDLYPSSKVINSTTKYLVGDILNKIKDTWIKYGKEKKDAVLNAANPVRFFMERIYKPQYSIGDYAESEIKP